MSHGGRTIAGGLIVVATATLVANAAAYVLSMAAARIMAVPEYGALGAMLSVSIIGGTVALGVQAVAARRIAVSGGRAGEERVDVSALTLILTLAMSAVGLLVSWPLGALLDVPVAAVILTFGAVAASIPGFAALGVLQGKERHRGFSWAYVAIGGLRALGGVAALMVHPDVTTTCAGIFVGSLAGSATAVFVARVPRPRFRIEGGLIRELGHTVSALVALFTLSNTDVLLARLFLDAQHSGEYAVGALIAKIAFFLPYAVNTVFYPKIASGAMRHAFALAVVLSAGIGAAVTLFCFALGDPLVWILGGEKYAHLGQLAWVFALEGSIFAVVQVILYAGFSSRARTVAILTWVAVVAQIVIIALVFHDSVEQIVTTTTVIAAMLAAAGIWAESRRTPAATRVPAQSGPAAHGAAR